MRDRTWIEARIAELKAGVDDLQVRVCRNQGAIKALEEVLQDEPPQPDALEAAPAIDKGTA